MLKSKVPGIKVWPDIPFNIEAAAEIPESCRPALGLFIDHVIDGYDWWQTGNDFQKKLEKAEEAREAKDAQWLEKSLKDARQREINHATGALESLAQFLKCACKNKQSEEGPSQKCNYADLIAALRELDGHEAS